MNNLAFCYRSAGALERALPLYQEAIRLALAKLGDHHPKTLAMMNDLANGYEVAGVLEEALPLLEEVLELIHTKLPDDHPLTLVSMRQPGRSLHAITVEEQPTGWLQVPRERDASFGG